MSQKAFAPEADLEEKQIGVVELAEGASAYTAEGDQAMWQSLEGE